MIAVDGLEFAYPSGPFRLRVPRFHVERRSRTALIGPSGAGKSTLLHLLAGIVTPDAGRVSVDGTEISSLADGARRAFRISRIGLVFQEFELLEYLSVEDNVLLPYRLDPGLRLDRSARERGRELAHSLGLGDKLSRYPASLSQGERQRVAVCRALTPSPVLLLADEPTGNLDPDNASRVLEALVEPCERQDVTLVAVTHDRGVLSRFDVVVDLEGIGVGS